jgi:hypothetical protein
MYIIISEETKNSFQGRKRGTNVFNSRQTIDGRWVVDDNTPVEFPKAFTGDEPLIELGPEDFPPDQLK